jgi:CHAT domain-containing protein/tetratricopeptide (TPR) repeat protein
LTRPFDQHLDGDELDALISLQGPGVTSSGRLSEYALGDVQRHVESCQDCHRKVQMHKSLQGQISREVPLSNVPGTAGCVERSEWVRVVAGLLPEDKTRELMKHAAQCGQCGPLLRDAANILSDDVTPDEEQLLASLDSARPAWRRKMAATLKKDSEARQPDRQVNPWWKTAFLSPRVAWAGALVVVVGLATWFALRSIRTPDADQLLVRAYTEKRTMEMRIDGARYTALNQERGAASAQDRMSRPALLRAESEIAQQLKSKPDNVTWLHARGRASLLEDQPDSAIASLEKAKEFDPDNASIAKDLATAYYRRAELFDRPEDDARAVDILAKVLTANPNDEVALFNYALALEQLSLLQQAIEQWSTFLASHPSSEWAPEARTRRSELEKRVRQHQTQIHNDVNTAAEIAAHFHDEPEKVLERLDGQAERYMDVAMREWLPNALVRGKDTSIESRSEWVALAVLAQILESRHKDRWLKDLLQFDHQSSGVRDAFSLTADVARLIDSSDDDRAAHEALRAAALFKSSNLPAGELYARFQLAYANQLSHRNIECAAIANNLLTLPQLRSYPWLRIQTEIESAICASTSDERALTLLREGFNVATLHHYEKVRSRANQVLSAIFWTVGDTHDAWSTSINGLRWFWRSDLPTVSGYNLLTNLDYLAEDQQEWFTQVAVLRESYPMVADDPDHAMSAFERNRLGQALLMTHDLYGAEASFREAQLLFQSAPAGTRKDNLGVESEIGLAKADLQRGLAETAASHLGAIRERVKFISDDDLTLDFLQTYGIALLRSNRPDEARDSLKASLRLAERGLHLVHTERDRLKWSRRNELTYRAMVELTVRTEPEQALAIWEWYKGASLRGGPRDFASSALKNMDDKVVLPRSLGNSILRDDTALVTFFLSDAETLVWISDTKGVQQARLVVTNIELEHFARSFARHCSDPSSSLETLRRESNALYELVISPIEPLIRGYRALLFEPDRDLKLVPFIALLDHTGRYLGDRYAITISPGLEYVAASVEWKGLSADSHVLVVGNPSGGGPDSLPDAEQEARTVAASFAHPVLLLRDDATYEKIISELPKSQLFHFAGHAVANSANAALLLSHSESLDVRKLETLRFHNSQLIVLSACSSADGSAGLFDDEDSLARRLIGAGSSDVVASRWSVDSGATAILMNSFYQRLVAGSTVGEAMTLAAKETRSRSGFEHPFYWASFSVFGRG